MRTTPWKGHPNVKEGANYSASYISWNDAAAYCQKLSESEGAAGRLPTDWQYALPTEAQWEYACRAGTTTRYHFGNDVTALSQHAWYDQNAINVGETYAHEVGQKLANPWGLYDINGNVWEWCRDRYADKLPGGTDPIGFASGSRRAIRGGSLSTATTYCRSANRNTNAPELRNFNLGFRVTLVPVAAVPNASVPTNTDSTSEQPAVQISQQNWARQLGRQVVEKNSVGMSLTLIPPGDFQMGSPGKELERQASELQHPVTIAQPFFLGTYEVTQEEYTQVMESNPSVFSQAGVGRTHVAGMDTSRFPAENLSWDDAVAFCQKLSQLEGKAYRLPTEAEWEYACRAGTSSPFSFGENLNGSQANCNGQSPYGTTAAGANLKRPARVGSYAPNAFGLHDMHGNAWEWCADWFDKDYYVALPAKDPLGPVAGATRVTRGGAWDYVARGCRSAHRHHNPPSFRNGTSGFRVVCEVASQPLEGEQDKIPGVSGIPR